MKVYYNEFHAPTAAWLRELGNRDLVPAGMVDERDIRTLTADDVKDYGQVHLFAGIGGWAYALKLAGWPDELPVWTGSCPCQPFSNAGKRAGTKDDRHLWPDMLRLIAECRPPVVFGEQSASDVAVEWLDGVWDDMEGIGYQVGATILPALSVGARHRRERVYFVAYSSGIRQPEPWEYQQDTSDRPSRPFGEADRLVDAVRRKALPFLCGGHDGVSGQVGEVCCHGLGNAIVPQVAATFIRAAVESIAAMPQE